MLPCLQSLVAKDLIKDLDDGNQTVLPAWDPMIFLFEHSIGASDFGHPGLARVVNRWTVKYFFIHATLVYLAE